MHSTPHPDARPNGGPQGIQPSVATLERLRIVKHWQHLLQMAQDRLFQRPDDVPGHQFSAIALMMLRRPKEAEKHVEWSLQSNAEDSYHYILAAQLTAQRGRLRAMKKLLNTGLSLDPQNLTEHQLCEWQVERSNQWTPASTPFGSRRFLHPLANWTAIARNGKTKSSRTLACSIFGPRTPLYFAEP